MWPFWLIAQGNVTRVSFGLTDCPLGTQALCFSFGYAKQSPFELANPPISNQEWGLPLVVEAGPTPPTVMWVNKTHIAAPSKR